MTSTFDPLYGLTREQLEAQGIDVDQWIAQQNARHEEQARADAKEFAAAAAFAVASGEMTEPEAAQMLLKAGQRAAHDLYVEAWRQEEAEVEAQIAQNDLSIADAKTYLEHVQAQDEQERERLQAQLIGAKDEAARAALGQMREQLDRFVASTPGAFQRDADIRKRVGELIVQADGVPADEAGRERMVQQALRDVAVREGVAALLVEQVETEWRAHEHKRRSDSFTARRSDDRSIAQRAEDEALWKAKRLQDLAITHVTPADIDAARELPPSPEEIAAAETAKYRERQERSDAFHRQVAEIARGGEEARADRDRGASITSERRAYREAVARAEREAMYGSGEPELRSGYGPDAVQEQRDVDAPLDEFGGPFGPNFTRA